MKKMPLAGLLIFVLIAIRAAPVFAGDIHAAAQMGKADEVRRLLEQGTDVNARDEDQRTPLHSAAIGCKADMAAILIDRWAILDVQDKYGDTPLCWTATNCKDDRLAEFLLRKGASPNIGFPLHKAVQYGRKDLVLLLLRNKADINAIDKYKHAPVDVALSPPRPDILVLLIDNDADYSRGVYGESFLHWGARQGLTDLVRLLLQKGVNVNEQDALSETPLHYAAKAGKTDVVDLLLQKGANVNTRNYVDETPLHFAADNGSSAVVQLLLQKGADINARSGNHGFEGKKGQIPLHFAASKGKTEAAALLIEKGSSVAAKDDMGRTPLHLAAQNGHIAVAELLMRKGADASARDNGGNTPSVTAEKNKHPQLAAILRNTGGGSASRDFKALVGKGVSEGGIYPTGRYVWREDLIVIIQLASTISPKPEIPEEAKRDMEKGQAAFKLARRPLEFEEAERYFVKAGKQAPWWPNPYFNLAVTQEKMMKFDDAKFNFENYLIAARNAADANAVRVKIAELDVQKKRYSDFANELNAGAEAYKKGPAGYAEAISRWKKATEICPDHPEADRAYYNLGDIYMRKGDLDSAYKYMQKAFELMPEPSESNRPGRYTNMGVVLERRGDRAKACIYYRKGCNNGSRVSCGNMSNCP